MARRATSKTTTMASRYGETLKLVCATNFTEESLRAFHHALAIALTRPCELTLLYVGRESRDQVPWNEFPNVRGTLAEWGILPENAPQEVLVEELALAVRKQAMRDEDPAMGIIDHLDRHSIDLLVMGADPPSGYSRLRRQSVATRVLRTMRVNALMIPKGSSGFIDASSGQARLRSVLWPIAPEPDARPSIAFAMPLLKPLLTSELQATTLFVGDQESAPTYVLPTQSGVRWQERCTDGEVAPTILRHAEEIDADLIAMATEGPEGLVELIRGSTTEQILRWAKRPLLSLIAS